MSCQDCSASRESSGAHRLFDPLCLFCGARLIQAIGKLPISPESVIARRRAVLADWMAMGHAEQDLRDLAKAKAPALEPIAKAARK